MNCRWEHYEHGADIGVRGLAPTQAGAFEQAALALTAVVTDPASVVARDSVPITCEAADDGLLFVGWLNALIYEMDVRRMLFSRFHVAIHGRRLVATASGEAISLERHRPAVELKGATFTSLSVSRREDGQWLAQTVVDV